MKLTQEQEQRWMAWWRREETDRPLVRIAARREFDERLLLPEAELLKCDFDFHLNPQFRVNAQRNHALRHRYLAEYVPYIDLNLGPGSMAAYLASEPGFSRDTIWYEEAKVGGLSELADVGFGRSTHWWADHLGIIREAVALAGEDMYVAIPDIQEGLDIVSAMRGPQNLCLDILDEPEAVRAVQAVVDRDFWKYYEAMYELVRGADGTCVFTAFAIWGKGRTAKIQCDFSSLISSAVYDEFALPGLKAQCAGLDFSMYHLDGKDAVRHLKSVLSMEDLDALQWTPGAGQPDGGSELWFPIYEATLNAGKAMWIRFEDGGPDAWIEGARRVLKRFGARGIYFWFPDTDAESAERVLRAVEGF